jgi:hypothetical protein
MGLILASLTVAVLWLRARWLRLYGRDPVAGIEMARNIKQGTNLLIVAAQATNFAIDVMSGMRTSVPTSFSSVTASPGLSGASRMNGYTIPGANAFGAQRAGSFA